MDTQHTPGPWEISEHTRPKGRPISICKFNGPAFTELAYVPSHGAYSEANARLIAAAPELLEALNELLPILDEWHAEFPECVGDKEGPVIVRARAALAKVKS